MNWGRHFLEAATLIVAAVVCALTANAFASRERKLAIVPSTPQVRTTLPPSSEAPAPSPATATMPAIVTTSAAAGGGAPPLKSPATTVKRQPVTPGKPPREFKPHPDKPYVEIHYDDVAALHNSGALFLDARRTSVYEAGHIAGARPFSVWESDIDDKVNKLFSERSDPRDQDKPIVVYCSGGDCEDSHMLAQKLWGIQFNNVYVYKDGYPDWEKRGGATRTGGKP